MRSLTKTLFRDAFHMRGQFIAVAVVVALGVAVWVQSRTTFRSLAISQATYYADYRFADVFVSVKRAPEATMRLIRAIPDISAAESRIVLEVTLDLPGLPEPATGRFVSLPSTGRPQLNDVFIRTGAYPNPAARNEVLISEPFAEANAFQIGDRFSAVINGRREELRIAGIALSPEFIYAIRGTDIFPDNRRFGIIWMNRDAIAPAFDMDGAFNDVVIALAPTASRQTVLSRLDTLLVRFGGLGAYDRTDHASHRFISDEIKQNEIMALVAPAIFLGVAAFLLHIVLARLVSTQRDQIALLKAFGYSDIHIGMHYLKLVMIPTLGGALAGTGIGLWAGRLQTEAYGAYYRFPLLQYVVDADVLGVGFIIAAVTATIGALGAVRRVVALPPAEAMRPEPPATFRPGFVERSGLKKLMSVSARMIYRNVRRRPVKSGLSVLGISLAVAIIIHGRYWVDVIDRMTELQFRHIQREDVTVMFGTPLTGRVEHELARMPGVMRIEPFRVVPVEISHEHRSERTALFGFVRDGELRRIVDRNFTVYDLPAHGLVMSKMLAELLGVDRGETLRVQVLEGSRPVREVVVTDLVDELLGVAAYMERSELHRFMREGPNASGAFIAIDPRGGPAFYADLKAMPAVQSVAILETTVQGFDETLAESMGIVTTILVLFSSAIAIGMVYNSARIALSERGRELASMRVLGFSRREVGWMLLGEQVILTALAIPVGFALGYGISALMPFIVKSEMFRVPLYLSKDTFIFAVQVVAGAAAVSAFLVRRRLDHMSLIEVLKTRE